MERPFKEAWHKLTVERGVIFNVDAIVPPKIFRQDVIKSVHDNIHGGVAVTQRLRLQAWLLGYCKDVEEHIRRCPKCTEIKTFKQAKIHTWLKEGVPWTRVHMDYAHMRSLLILDLSRFLLRFAGNNKRGQR